MWLLSPKPNATEHIYCILFMSVHLHIQNETADSQVIHMLPFFPFPIELEMGNHSNNQSVA